MTSLWDMVELGGLVRTDLSVLKKNLHKKTTSQDQVNTLINLSLIFDETFPAGSVVHVGLFETKMPIVVNSGSYPLLDHADVKFCGIDEFASKKKEIELSLFDLEEFSGLWEKKLRYDKNK